MTTYQTFTFSADETAYLLEMAISSLMDNAQHLRQLDKKKQPDAYAQMLKLVMTGSMAVATLNGLVRTDLTNQSAPQARAVPPELAGLGAGGDVRFLDAETLDRIASNPHCVHGLPFTEHCRHCNPPADGSAPVFERPLGYRGPLESVADDEDDDS